MATLAQPTTTMPGAGGGANAPQIADPGNPLAALLPLLINQQQKVTGGVGDVSGLQALLAQLMPTTAAGGMSPVIQAIFQEGFQKQMPGIYNASNQAGMRPGSTTQQALLVNDLNAKLAAEGAKAVAEQQKIAANVAANIAANSKTPTVTTNSSKINTNNALLAAAIPAGVKLIGSLFGNGGGDVATSAPAGSAGDVFNTKKRNAAGSVGTVMDTILGPAQDPLAGIFNGGMQLPSASTGGINPNALGGNGSFGPINPSGYGAGNFITDFISGTQQGGFDQGLSNATAMYAMSQIPVVGPYVAAANVIGDAVGIKEVGQITSGVANAIGDIGTAVADVFGCYITTAVCELNGKPDDCDELRTLRNFRDDWLKKQPGGEALVQQYYEQAPRFLAAVSKSGFRDQMLRHFDETYIRPSVAAVKAGDNDLAFRHYVAMLADANTYITHMER